MEKLKNTPRKSNNTPRKLKNTPRKSKNTPRESKNTPRESKNTPRKSKNTPQKNNRTVNPEISPNLNKNKYKTFTETKIEKYKKIYDKYLSDGNKIYLEDIKLDDVVNLDNLLLKLVKYKNNFFDLEDEFGINLLIFNYKDDIVMFEINYDSYGENKELEFTLINKNFTTRGSCIISTIYDIKDDVYEKLENNVSYIKNGIVIPCIGKYNIDSNFKKIINKYKKGIYCGYDGSMIRSANHCIGPDDKKGTWIVNLKRDLFQALGCKYIMLIDASRYDLFPIFYKNLLNGITPISWYEKFGYKHYYNMLDLFNIIKKINIYDILLERFNINTMKDDNLYTLEEYLMDIYEFGKNTNIDYINSFLSTIINYHSDNKNSYVINYFYYIKKNGLMANNIYDDLQELKYDVKKLILKLKDTDIKYDYIISLISNVFLQIDQNKTFLIYDCEK